jgi:hypothetical protein
VQPVDDLHPQVGELVTAVDQQAHHLQIHIFEREFTQPTGVHGDSGDRMGVGGVLRPCPVSNTRTRAASLAGTSRTRSPSRTNRNANGRPAPPAPSTAQTRDGHCFTYRISAW